YGPFFIDPNCWIGGGLAAGGDHPGGRRTLVERSDLTGLGSCNRRANRQLHPALRDQRTSKTAHSAGLLCSDGRRESIRRNGTFHRTGRPFSDPRIASDVAGIEPGSPMTDGASPGHDLVGCTSCWSRRKVGPCVETWVFAAIT